MTRRVRDDPLESMLSKLLFFSIILASFHTFADFSLTTEEAKQVVEIQFAICQAEDEVKDIIEDYVDDTDKYDVSYYDDSKYSLYRQKVQLKVRDDDDERLLDTKVRFTNFSRKPKDLPKSAECEFDRYANQSLYSCRIRSEQESSRLHFSDDQLDLLKLGGIDPHTLSLKRFGPYPYKKWTLSALGIGHAAKEITVDRVRAKEDLIEFSVRTTKDMEDEIYQKSLAWIKAHDLQLCRVQQDRFARLITLQKYR